MGRTYLCGPRRWAEESHISIIQVQGGVEKDVKEEDITSMEKTEKMYIYNTVHIYQNIKNLRLIWSNI